MFGADRLRRIMSNFDAWAAKHLFHPIIRLVCQRTALTQWALYRVGWWLFAVLSILLDQGRDWAFTALLVLFALSRTIPAGLNLNAPAKPSVGIRYGLWFGLLATVLFPTDVSKLDEVIALLLALAAEYATTMKPILPHDQQNRA